MDERCKTCANEYPCVACVNCGSEHWNYSPKSLITSDWISVTDRLPNENENVLCTDGEDYFIGYYREDCDSWDNFNMGWLVSYYHNGEPVEPNITHWQRLPELPIEEKVDLVKGEL